MIYIQPWLCYMHPGDEGIMFKTFIAMNVSVKSHVSIIRKKVTI